MQPMSLPLSRRLVAIVVFSLLLPLVVMGAKGFVKPAAKPAFNYPAHDLHRDEQVTIAADPYDTPDKAKIFSINFTDHGFLPIFFIVTNDGDQPVSIINMHITLMTSKGSKLTPVDTDGLYRRLSNPSKPGTNVPLPFPRKVKGTVSKQEMDEIASSQFAAKAVEPHGTQAGFFYFDVAGLNSPLRGGTIDISGVDDAKGTELIFFEIDMDKYLNSPRNP